MRKNSGLGDYVKVGVAKALRYLMQAARFPRIEWSRNYRNWVERTWPSTDFSERNIDVRYGLLSRMLELDAGDLLILPNVPANGSFAVVQVKEKYYFQLDPKTPTSYGPDYGHIIPIDYDGLRSFRNNESLVATTIWNRVRKQRSCFGLIRDTSFGHQVQSLLAGETATKADREDTGRTTTIVDLVRQKMISTLSETLTSINPHEVEKLIRGAFEQAGYRYIRGNKYDRKGGDADLVFECALPFLSEATSLVLTIYIQVKQRRGIAANDIDGVRQVSKISADNPMCVRLLISTADDFDEECSKVAEELGVVLVSGPQLAEVLTRFL